MNIIEKIVQYILVKVFLLSSQKKQDYLIEKNARMFLQLLNLANKCDKEGDVVTSILISSESFKYLGNFALYCNAKGIDQVERLHKYTK